MIFSILKTQPARLLEIVGAMPAWTWTLFAVLLVIGLAQLRTRTMTVRRAWSISLLLAGMGLAGLLYSFRSSPDVNGGTAVWIAVAIVGMQLFARLPARARAPLDRGAPAGAADVEGSWLPLALIVFAIASRYIATLEIIVNPAALQDGTFVLAMSAIYGVASAGFLGRARAVSRAIAAVSPADGRSTAARAPT